MANTFLVCDPERLKARILPYPLCFTVVVKVVKVLFLITRTLCLSVQTVEVLFVSVLDCFYSFFSPPHVSGINTVAISERRWFENVVTPVGFGCHIHCCTAPPTSAMDFKEQTQWLAVMPT